MSQIPNLSKTKFVRLLLAISLLVSGIGIGSAVTQLYSKETHTSRSSTEEISQNNAKAIAQSLRGKLRLQDEQVEMVERTIDQRIKALAAIRSELNARVANEHKQLADEMRLILNDDQFAKWVIHFEEIRRRRTDGKAYR